MPQIPSVDELLDRARELKPVLAERAEATEAARQLLPESLADFEDAGFYRISQPKEFGGYEMSPEILFNVAMELARGCPSSAWCLCLIGVHNWEPGLMDRRAAEDLWGADDTVRYSSSYAPFGRVQEVEGGYRLSGRWEWSSGSDHCSWVMLGAILRKEEGPPEQIAMLVPASDYEVIDNWHVAGLKGTGSHDILVEDAFVPEHRVHVLGAPSKRHFNSPIYDLPFQNIFGMCLASVTQGIAEGALDTYTSYLRERVHKYDGQAMALDPFQQRRLSEATIDVEANRRSVRSTFDRLFDALDSAEGSNGQHIVPPELQIRLMWETQNMAHCNADIVTTLMRASGGGAQRLAHPMQRYFRDINAAVAHAFLNVDRGSLQFAQAALHADN